MDVETTLPSSNYTRVQHSNQSFVRKSWAIVPNICLVFYKQTMNELYFTCFVLLIIQLLQNNTKKKTGLLYSAIVANSDKFMCTEKTNKEMTNCHENIEIAINANCTQLCFLNEIQSQLWGATQGHEATGNRKFKSKQTVPEQRYLKLLVCATWC